MQTSITPHTFSQQVIFPSNKDPFFFVMYQYSWTARAGKDVRNPIAQSTHLTHGQTASKSAPGLKPEPCLSVGGSRFFGGFDEQGS